MPRPCERKLGRDAGFVLKLAQTDWLVPQEDRMAPGTLSQGGRRGGRGQARPPPPGARGSARARARAASAAHVSADAGGCVATRGLRETKLHGAFHVGAASGARPLSPRSIFCTLGAHAHPGTFRVCEGPVLVTCRSPPTGQRDLKTAEAPVRLHASTSHCGSRSGCPGRDASE